MEEVILRLMHRDQMSDLIGQALFFILQASGLVKVLLVLVVVISAVVFFLCEKERTRLKNEKTGLILAPSSLYILMVWLLHGGFVAYHIITGAQIYPQSIMVLPIQVILLLIGTAKALVESPRLAIPMIILRICLFAVPVYLLSALTANLVLLAFTAVAAVLVIVLIIYIV